MADCKNCHKLIESELSLDSMREQRVSLMEENLMLRRELYQYHAALVQQQSQELAALKKANDS